MANIVLSEKELSVQVRHLNIIVVSAVNLAFFRASNTHDGKSLDQLTTKSTGTNHEKIDFLQFLLNFSSVNLDLIVVSTVHWLSINGLTWKAFKDIMVQPLSQRSVLASLLHYFLGNDTTEEGSHW